VGFSLRSVLAVHVAGRAMLRAVWSLALNGRAAIVEIPILQIANREAAAAAPDLIRRLRRGRLGCHFDFDLDLALPLGCAGGAGSVAQLEPRPKTRSVSESGRVFAGLFDGRSKMLGFFFISIILPGWIRRILRAAWRGAPHAQQQKLRASAMQIHARSIARHARSPWRSAH
jgi:hypothetical protein